MSNTSQKYIGTIIYALIVLASIVTITGIVWTILDYIMPIGKTALFLELNLGLQIAIIGAILAALIFLILLFYSLFRRGRKTIVEMIFKEKTIPERYKNRTGIKIATGMVIICIFAVIIGIIYALIVEIALGSTPASSGLFLSLSGGEIVLLIGFSLFLLDALFVFLILLWINGYFYILKLITNLEKEE
jgi:hypothetical protein